MKKISYYGFLILIIFLPLQKLVEEILSQNFSLSPANVFWISHWYEFFIAAALISIIWQCFVGRRCVNFKIMHKPSLYFLTLALASAFLLSPELSRGIEGLRFTALPVLFLLLARYHSFSPTERALLIKTYMLMAVVVAVWGLLERFAPLHYWQSVSLNDFGWGKYEIVGKFYQSASIMNGPNQLASYLLPAIFIQLEAIFGNKLTIKPRLNLAKIIILVMLLAAVLLTFSRSALIALVVAVVGYFIFGRLGCRTKVVATLVIALALIIGFFALKPNQENFKALIYHGGSQLGHVEALDLTISELKSRSFDELILGAGIGSAGPAAIKHGDGIVSESWYLQLLLELGLMGLLFWFWLIIDLFISLNKQRIQGLAFGLLAISVSSIFLHTWADNPAIALTLMILIGAVGGNMTQKVDADAKSTK